MEESEAAHSEEEWDTANAAFHEFQIDLAGNAMLSHVYREMPVNLIMQVIRGGRLEGGEHLVARASRDRRGLRGRRPAGRPAGDPDAHRRRASGSRSTSIERGGRGALSRPRGTLASG